MSIINENLFQNNHYNRSHRTTDDNTQTKSSALAWSLSSLTTTTVAATPTIRSIDMHINNHQHQQDEKVQKQSTNPFEDNVDTSINLDNKELLSSQPKNKEQIVPSAMNPFENKNGEESSQINSDPVHLSHSCYPSTPSKANDYQSIFTPKLCHELKF